MVDVAKTLQILSFTSKEGIFVISGGCVKRQEEGCQQSVDQGGPVNSLVRQICMAVFKCSELGLKIYLKASKLHTSSEREDFSTVSSLDV